MKLIITAFLFIVGLALCMNEGYWFPIPNFIGVGVMVLVVVLVKDQREGL